MLYLLAIFSIALAGCTRTVYPPADYGFNIEKSYYLDSGDEVRVIVLEIDDITQTYAVDASGHISVPRAGTILARGRTVAQLERAIAGRLRANQIQDPKVAVQVATYRPFFIHGEVRNAGKYAYVHGLTVDAAIAVAGGYTDRAARTEARIVRPVPNGTEVSYVPLGFQVLPGDAIYVPERWF